MKKELKLKYGEYYNLKITDSNKNVINNVEIVGCQINSEQTLFSKPSYLETDYSDDESKKELIDELMKGESRLRELLKNEKDSTEESDELKELKNEFYSWTYLNIPNQEDKDIDYIKKSTVFETDKKFEDKDKEVAKHDLKCEIQVLERTPIKVLKLVPVYVWQPVKLFGVTLYHVKKRITFRFDLVKTGEFEETYRWTDEFTKPRLYNETLTSVKYNVDINQTSLKNKLELCDGTDRLFFIKNIRYKLTGGVINIEKLQKETISDEESNTLRGKNSYTYPESTLIEADAKVSNNKKLINYIGEHIIEQYKDGRETMEMTWQGDPTMTLGDSIIVEDKFGIEKKFMITGNEFVLENSGKFYMRTEGISV